MSGEKYYRNADINVLMDSMNCHLSCRYRSLRYLLVMLFVGGILGATAQVTRTSVSSGNWASSSVWSPAGTPGASDNIIISPGHTITYNGTNYTNSGSMTVTGTLLITSLSPITFTVGSLSGSGDINISGGAHTLRAGNNFSTTYSGVISGAGVNFSKQGTGILTFTGAHTYTGNTSVNGGILILSESGSLGGGTYSGAITLNGASLNVATTTNQTLSGAITGSGSILKENTGTLTLTSASNTYNGTTSITGGEIRLNPTANAAYATRFILNGGSLSTVGIASGRTITSSAALQLDASSSIDLGNVVHTLSFAGSALQSWNTSALLTVTGWTGSAGLPGTAGRVFFGNSSGGLSVIQLAQTGISGYPWNPFLRTDGELVPSIPPNTYTWNATSGNADWQAPGSWTPARVTPQNTDILNFSNGGSSVATNVPSATIGQFIMSNNTKITLEAAANGNTLTIQGNAGADLSIPQGSPEGSSLTLGNSSNAMNMAFTGANHVAMIGGSMSLNNTATGSTFNTANSITTITSTGTLDVGATLSGNVVNEGSIIFSRLNDYSYAGSISGSGQVFKLGPGILSLTGSHTFTGLTTINEGSISVGVGGTTGSLTGNIVNSGTLIFNRSDNSEYPGDISGNGPVSKLGAGTLSITGELTHTGATTITGGALSIGNGGAGGTVSASTAIINNSVLIFNRSDNFSYSGVITGPGTIRKEATGTLLLTGANAYTGTTIIAAGTLELGASGVLPDASNIILSGGTLSTGSVAGFSETVGTLTLQANSSIALGTGNHSLNFANSTAVPWTVATQLRITGWQGLPTQSGTAGKIFFGAAPHLTSTQLGQIEFSGFLGTPQLLITGEIVPPVAPLIYTWNAITGNASWTNPASWTPQRNSASSSDILLFSNGGTSTATNVTTQTISQIVVRSNTRISLEPETSGNMLTLQGGAGTDLSIEYGSGLTLGATTALDLSFQGTGNLADIRGDMRMNSASVFNTANSTTTITGNNTVAPALRPRLYAMGSNNLSGNIVNNGIIEFGNAYLNPTDGGHLYKESISGTGEVYVTAGTSLTVTGNNTYTGTTYAAGSDGNACVISIGNNSTTGSISGDILCTEGEIYFNRSNDYNHTGNIIIDSDYFVWIRKNYSAILTLTGKIIDRGIPGNTDESHILLVQAGSIRLGGSNVIGDSMRVWLSPNTFLDLNGFSETIGSMFTNNQTAWLINSAPGALDTLTVLFRSGGNRASIRNGTTGSVVGRAAFALGSNSAVFFTDQPISVNTYTGGTFIYGGRFRVVSAGRIGGDILNNGICDFDITGTWNFSGVISGTGNLEIGNNALVVKTAGTITLAGANTYSGATIIKSDMLQLGAANRINPISNLILTGNLINIATFRTGSSTGFSQTFRSLLLQGNGTIALGTGSHSLTFGNSSGEAWNIFNPNHSPNEVPVTLTITGWAGTAGNPGTAGRIFFGSSASGLTAQQLSQIVFSNFPNNPAMLLPTGELVPGTAPAVYVWRANTGTADWNTPGSWNPDRINPLPGDILRFTNGGTVTASNVPTQTIAQLQINNTTVTFLAGANGNVITLGGAAGDDLSLTGTSGSLTLGSSTPATNAMILRHGGFGGNTANIARPLTLAAGNIANSYDARGSTSLLNTNGVINNLGTLLGAIRHPSGTGAVNMNRDGDYLYSDSLLNYPGASSGTQGRITKNGNGMLTLNGLFAFRGGLTISSGTLRVGNGGSDGTIRIFTTGTFVNNASLIWNKNIFEPWTFRISGPGSFTKEGVGHLQFTSDMTYTGTTTISAGTLHLGGPIDIPQWGNATGMVQGNIVNNGTLIFQHSNNRSYTNVISGTGSFVKKGSNVLTFSTAQTYTGSTSVNSGTLQLGADNRIADLSTLIMAGGIFRTGATTGFSETMGTLRISLPEAQENYNRSTIQLGTGRHDLRFANTSAEVWAPGESLTITGWTGTAGSQGTAGRIYFGTDATGLTPAQLSRITIAGYLGTPILRPDGELVPNPTPPPSYSWKGGVNDWTDPNSWTPARVTPLPNDILIFTGSLYSTEAYNVPTQTIERLIVSNYTTLTLRAASDGSTLTIQGTTGCGELYVDNTAGINLGADINAMNLVFGSGCNTGVIAGQVSITNGRGAGHPGSTFNTTNSTTYLAGGTILADGTWLGNVILANPGGTLYLAGINSQTFSMNRVQGSGRLTIFKAWNQLNNLALNLSGTCAAGIFPDIIVMSGSVKVLTAEALPETGFDLGLAGCVFDVNGFNLNALTVDDRGSATSLITNSSTLEASLTVRQRLSMPAGSIEDGSGKLSLVFEPLTATLEGDIGNPNYTGKTTIFPNAEVWFRSAPKSLEIENDGLLGFADKGPGIFPGVISGTGNVVRDVLDLATGSSGSTTLTGTNTFSGNTIVGLGKLELGASETLPDAANMQLGSPYHATGSCIFSTGAVTGFSETLGTLKLFRSATISLGSGSHTLSFANSSAEFWEPVPTLTISGWQGTPGSSGTAGRIFIGNNATGLSPAQLSQISFLGYLGAAMLLPTGELVPAIVNPNYVWNPTTPGPHDFQLATNWTPARITPGPNDLLAFTNTGNSVASNVPNQSIGRLIVDNNTSITLQAAANGNTLQIQGGNGSDFVVGSNSTLTLGNGPNALTLAYFGSAISAAISGTLNISEGNLNNTYNAIGSNTVVTPTGTLNVAGTLLGNVSNNGQVVFSRLASGLYSYTGVISGTGRFVKRGSSSTLRIDGVQTYTGETSIEGGILQPAGNNLFPDFSAFNFNGGFFDLNGFSEEVGSISGLGIITNSMNTPGTITVGRDNSSTTFSGVIQNGPTATVRLIKTGEGNLVLSSDNIYTGGTIINQGVLQLGAGGASGSVQGDVELKPISGSNPELSFFREGEYTYSGIISGTGDVSKLGIGRVNFTADHTFQGTAFVNQGTLSIGNATATGSLACSSIQNFAMLLFSRSNQYIYTGIIAGTGIVEKRSSGTLIFTGNHTYTGETRIFGGTLSLGNNTTGGSVAGNIAIRVNSVPALVFNRSNDLTYSGIISNSGLGSNNGQVHKRGGGVLFLTGSNTYNGGTDVQAGTLSIGNGGTTGSVINSAIATGSGTVVIFDRSNDMTYSSVISGGGSVIKQGAGTLTLSGVNSYTGATFISAGTLQLSGAPRISDNSRIELSGGTLRTAGNPNNETVSTLTLGASSAITLGNGMHDLKFANSAGVAWSGGTTLTINNWQGTGGLSGGGGTAGRIFFGDAAGTLTAQQLSQISFTGFAGTPILLPTTGELVPGSAAVICTVDPPSYSPAVCINNALTPSVTHATTATAIGTPTGLPGGVTATWAANTISISGTPTASGIFNYSIPLGGNCIGSGVSATGTITVNPIEYMVYRTTANGNFSTVGIWQVADNCNLNFTPAATSPPVGSRVLIRHDVTLNTDFTVSAQPLILENNGVSKLTIAPTRTLSFGASGGNAEFNNRPVVVQSTSAGTGAIGTMWATARTTGDENVTVERFIPNTGGRRWNLLTFGVTNGSTMNTNATIRDAWAGGSRARVSNSSNRASYTPPLPFGTPPPYAPEMVTHGLMVKPPNKPYDIATGGLPADYVPGDGTVITGHKFENAPAAHAAGFDWWPELSIPVGAQFWIYDATRTPQYRLATQRNSPSTSPSGIRFYRPGVTGDFNETRGVDWISDPTINGNGNPANSVPNTRLANALQGYMLFIRGDRQVLENWSSATTLRPTGKIRSAEDVLVPIEAKTTQALTLVGNPFPAPLDFQKVLDTAVNSNLIEPRFHLWDSKFEGLYGVGAWRTVFKAGSNWWATIPGLPDSIIPNAKIISSSQAVMVEAKAGAGNLVLTERMKGSVNDIAITPFSDPDTPAEEGLLFVNLNLEDTSGRKALDGVSIIVGKNATAGLSDGNDIPKLFNFASDYTLSILRNNIELVVEAHPDPELETIFPLLTRGLQTGRYGFSFHVKDLYREGRSVFLRDKFLKTETPVSTLRSSSYVFDADGGTAGSVISDRFEIVFRQTNIKVLPVNFLTLSAREEQADVAVNWQVATEENMSHYEVEYSRNGSGFTKGVKVTAKNTSPSAYSWVHSRPGSGFHYYRVRGVDHDGNSVLSRVVKVGIGSDKPGFKVYPTVVSVSPDVTLELTSLKRGRYLVQVTDMNGRVMFTHSLEHGGGSSAQLLRIPGAMASGRYNVRLMGENEETYMDVLIKK